jgi:hypothetical protein
MIESKFVDNTISFFLFDFIQQYDDRLDNFFFRFSWDEMFVIHKY